MILTVTGILLSLIGCTWVDPYSEYRGVNLISNRGFDIDDFAEGYQSDPGDTFSYITLTSPGDYGATEGLPDTETETLASIRSLEVVNLIPNGDFEDGTTAPWITDQSGLTLAKPDPGNFVTSQGGNLTGWYVDFSLTATQGVAIALDSLSTTPVVQGGRYFIEYRFLRADADQTITLDFGDNGYTSYNALAGVSWKSEAPGDSQTPVVEQIPDASSTADDIDNTFVVNDTPNYLYIGSPAGAETQTGSIDDVRVSRMDIQPVRELSIPVEGAADELPLVAGDYTFSVYVKAEVSSEVTPGASGRNRFRAGQIALGTGYQLTLVSQNDGGWTTGTWTRVSTVISVSPDDIAAGNPLGLQLAIFSQQHPTVGSVLIANPELTLGTAE